MKVEELKSIVDGVKAQIDKAKAEITQKIADLEAAIGVVPDVPQEVVDALDALKASVQGVDDIVPDAPVE